METTQCLLCGHKTKRGLKILGHMICFPCEKKLMMCRCSPGTRRRLMKIYREK